MKVTLKGTSQFVYTDSLGRYNFSGNSQIKKNWLALSTNWDEKAGSIFWNPSVRKVRIRISDAQGKRVYESRPLASVGNFRLPVERLKQGIFILQVNTDEGVLQLQAFLCTGKIKNAVVSRSAQKSSLASLVLGKKSATSVVVSLEKKGWFASDTSVDNARIDMTLSLKRQKIKVLIVDGFSNHNWQQSTIVLKAILAQTEFFQVDVSTSPADLESSPLYNAWNPDFKAYDVVVMNTANIFTQIR